MDQQLEQQVQQRMQELPDDVRNAITASDLGAKIHAVGTKHQLHIDQVGELETQIYLSMLGFVPLEELKKHLESDLDLPPDKAALVAEDINTQIFGSIRESMKKFAAERQAPTPKAPSQPAATMPEGPAAPTKAPLSPEMHQAEVMLSQKTVSLAPKTEEKPIYKADPYREPV